MFFFGCFSPLQLPSAHKFFRHSERLGQLAHDEHQHHVRPPAEGQPSDWIPAQSVLCATPDQAGLGLANPGLGLGRPSGWATQGFVGFRIDGPAQG